jgi:hypothetical protein
MSHWLWWGLNLNPGCFICFTFIFISFGESRLLISWYADGRCGMAGSDEDRCRSRRPSAVDRRWSYRSGTRWPDDRGVRWRCVRSAPCTWIQGVLVFWLSLKTKVDGLLVLWAQNHLDSFLWFGLKTGGDGFSRFVLKTGGEFLGWASKPRWWRVFRFKPQNCSYDIVIWALKSPRRFFGLCLKTKGRWFIGCTSKSTEGWRRGIRVKI